MHSLSKIDEGFNNKNNMTKIGKIPKDKRRWMSWLKFYFYGRSVINFNHIY